MLISAEIRWFWRDTAPEGLEDWFSGAAGHPNAAGGGGTRTDDYLRDTTQSELGIKRRGGRKSIEIKGLVSVLQEGLDAGPLVGEIELWAKWISGAVDLESDATIAVGKRRMFRKFDTSGPLPEEVLLGPDEAPIGGRQWPSRGCNAELTRVTLERGDVWWTFGLEAFGTLSTVERDLRAVADVLSSRRPPELPEGLLASYPAWLKTLPDSA